MNNINKKVRMVVMIPLIILVAVFTVGYVYVWNFWWPAKQAKIVQGLASFDFPYKDYSPAELNKMYPQIKNADIPTRVTPEETYAKFREALRTNNLELALGQLNLETGKVGRESEQFLKEEYAAGRLNELYSHYPENVKKANMYEALAQYEYNYYSAEYKKELIGTINFVKNANGDWKMDSL